MAYEFSGFTVDERLFQLRQGTREVPVRPQVFDTLWLLISERHRVVSKAELIERVWRGARVTENAVSQCIREVRRALGQAAESESPIVTVHGRGFRFTAEVTTPIVPFPEDWAGAAAARAKMPPYAAAVLPFEDTSGDPEEANLGRGLAENLTRALARAKTVPIIAASSTWRYERRGRSLEAAGAELGAGYLVEGRVHRVGTRLRVRVHLSDATKGTEVWSEHFDADSGDSFALEDDLAAAVAGAIHPELVRSVAGRASGLPEKALDARLLVVRGLDHFYRRLPADNQLAISYFTKAAEADEALASYYLGLSHYNNVYYQWHGDFAGNLAHARHAAELCRRTAPGDASAHMLDGLLHLFSGDAEQARASSELAVEANPSLAEARALLGRVLAVAGDGRRSLEQVQVAMRLSPRDPWPGDLVSALAIAHFVEGRYEESADRADCAVRHAPQLLSNHLLAAASRALLGDLAGARRAAAHVLRLSTFSPAPFHRLLASSPEELRTRFFRGLALAGLPAGS